jgi:hypothetical protein
MKQKIQRLCDRFVELLSSWPGIECVVVNEDAEGDTLDPYFALIFDVFYNAPIPDAAERAKCYGDDIAALENSRRKDRFLLGDIPVHLEFKSTQAVEEMIGIAEQGTGEHYHLTKNSGTYGFYRLTSSRVFYSRERRSKPRKDLPVHYNFHEIGWIAGVRTRLSRLPDSFWAYQRQASQSKMEHYLTDFGAAFIQDDAFNYFVSGAGFIKLACMTLFAVNRRFEPSHRAYQKQVLELPVLPANFNALFDTFLRTGSGATPEQRYAQARAIAKGIVTL